MSGITALIILILIATAYVFGRSKSIKVADGDLSTLHSRPAYHGLYCAVWTGIIGIGLLLLFQIISSQLIERGLYGALPGDLKNLPRINQERIIADAKALARKNRGEPNVIVPTPLKMSVRVPDPNGTGQTIERIFEASEISMARDELATKYESWMPWRRWLTVLLSLFGAGGAFYVTYGQVSARWRSRNLTENVIRGALFTCAAIAVMTTIGIVLSLIGETMRFFSEVPIYKFLFGTHWSPLSGVFEGKINPNSVGVIPLFAGTLMITAIAMLVAVPIGLMAAIYLSDYAGARVRAWAKPLLEILAGIPTVVYGFFAAITVAPYIRRTGETLGLNVASESALAAGVVMGIMIIPFISSLSDDVISAVPQSLRDGSLGIGATKAETITKVILPAALPGIVSAVLLGISRAVGETMIVVMAAGQGANLTWNPLEAVTTVTVQIVALITGDTEASTAAGPAFALGFTLFCVTLLLNIIALRIVQKYRQKYD